MTTNEFRGSLLDPLFRFAKFRRFVTENQPELFLEVFAAEGGVTLSLLFNDDIEHGVLVVQDPEVACFWREALETDHLSRKVDRFKMSEAAAEDIVNHPETDPALSVLVQARCTWKGLRGKSFVITNPDRRWQREALLAELAALRSLANRLRIVQARELDIVTQFDGAMLFVHKWIRSKANRERLSQILALRRGPWLVMTELHIPSDQADDNANGKFLTVGHPWLVPSKVS
jgi:hypothetical protein